MSTCILYIHASVCMCDLAYPVGVSACVVVVRGGGSHGLPPPPHIPSTHRHRHRPTKISASLRLSAWVVVLYASHQSSECVSVCYVCSHLSLRCRRACGAGAREGGGPTAAVGPRGSGM
jgi:hypothetical protein